MSGLRNWIAAAELDLRRRLEARGAREVRVLLISHFGLEDAPEALERWPASSIAGLARVPSLASSHLSLRRFGAHTVLCHDIEVGTQPPPSAEEQAAMVWLAGRLGLQQVLLWVAGEGIEDALPAPSLVVIADLIRWQLDDPLRDWPAAREGARFPQLRPFAPESALARARHHLQAAGQAPRGVTALVRSGPSGATRAEVRCFGRLGAEVILEAGAAEAVAARHAGLSFLALALVLDTSAETPVDPGTLADRADQLVPALLRVTHQLVLDLPATSPAAEREEEA